MEILPYFFEGVQLGGLEILGGPKTLPVDVVLKYAIDNFIPLASLYFRVWEEELVEVTGWKFGELQVVFVGVKGGELVLEVQLTDLWLEDVVFEGEFEDVDREEGLLLGVGLVQEQQLSLNVLTQIVEVQEVDHHEDVLKLKAGVCHQRVTVEGFQHWEEGLGGEMTEVDLPGGGIQIGEKGGLEDEVGWGETECVLMGEDGEIWEGVLGEQFSQFFISFFSNFQFPHYAL